MDSAMVGHTLHDSMTSARRASSGLLIITMTLPSSSFWSKTSGAVSTQAPAPTHFAMSTTTCMTPPSPGHRQGVQAVDERLVERLEGQLLQRNGLLDRRDAAQERGEHGLQLHPDQGLARAHVPAVAEGQAVPGLLAGQVEGVRVLVDGRVVVARGQRADDTFARLDQLATDHRVLGRDAHGA